MKPARALAPERALSDELAHAWRDWLTNLLADRGGDVEADEVEQRERPHRVARAKLHARVDVGGVHARLFEQAHCAEEVREQQAVDDEAGNVGDLDGRLLEQLAQRARAL